MEVGRAVSGRRVVACVSEDGAWAAAWVTGGDLFLYRARGASFPLPQQTPTHLRHVVRTPVLVSFAGSGVTCVSSRTCILPQLYSYMFVHMPIILKDRIAYLLIFLFLNLHISTSRVCGARAEVPQDSALSKGHTRKRARGGSQPWRNGRLSSSRNSPNSSGTSGNYHSGESIGCHVFHEYSCYLFS